MAIALSIRQPWAELILRKEKDIEIRTWLPKNITPPFEIFIHASSRFDKLDMQNFNIDHVGLNYMALVGVARVIGFVEYKTKKHFNQDNARHRNKLSWYDGRQKGLILSNVMRLDHPIDFLGKLGLFKVDEHLLDLDEDQVTELAKKLTLAKHGFTYG